MTRAIDRGRAWRVLGWGALIGCLWLMYGCGATYYGTSYHRPGLGQGSATAARPATARPTQAQARPVMPTAYGELALPAEELAIELNAGLPATIKSRRVAVMTLVDLNDLNRTSAFGRALSEALSAYLTRLGFEVVELRQATNFLIQPRTGEFYLSRDVAHLAAEHEVSGVVVGLYAEARDMVMVTTRLISAADGRVLSTSLRELPKSSNLMYLLGKGGGLAQVAKTVRRAPAIPPASVQVFERPPKGASKIRR